MRECGQLPSADWKRWRRAGQPRRTELRHYSASGACQLARPDRAWPRPRLPYGRQGDLALVLAVIGEVDRVDGVAWEAFEPIGTTVASEYMHSREAHTSVEGTPTWTPNSPKLVEAQEFSREQPTP